jgi:hypothetical protein
MSVDVSNVIAMIKDGFDSFLEDANKCDGLTELQVPGHRLINELNLFFPQDFPPYASLPIIHAVHLCCNRKTSVTQLKADL